METLNKTMKFILKSKINIPSFAFRESATNSNDNKKLNLSYNFSIALTLSNHFLTRGVRS